MSDTQPQNAQSKRTDSAARHRRESRNTITLPFFLVFVVLLAMVIAVLLLPQRAQVSLVADWMTLWLILCPVVICLFPIYLGVMLGIYGMNRLHKGTRTPLEKLQVSYSKNLKRVTDFTGSVNQRMIDTQVKLTPYMRYLQAFDSAPEAKQEQEEQPDGDSTRQ